MLLDLTAALFSVGALVLEAGPGRLILLPSDPSESEEDFLLTAGLMVMAGGSRSRSSSSSGTGCNYTKIVSIKL